jgi:hypothetical protein
MARLRKVDCGESGVLDPIAGDETSDALERAA